MALPICSAADLAIYPADVTLKGLNTAHQIIVVSEEGGQTIADHTSTAQFVSANPKITSIDKTGRVTALADGETAITATVDGKQAIAKVHVSKTQTPAESTFRNHVIPVLTRMGCNSGACHGALAGKGGLKLSLRGYDPETDHFVLTRQALARRVDQSRPEKSLLLLKPTRTMPHGGGRRFDDDSREYQILLDWIKAGAKSIDEKDAKLERLEVLPASARLKPKDTFRIVVRAWYSDGTVEDVTSLARFTSSEDLVANVNDAGFISVVGYGEAAINVGFGTRVAAVTVTSPFANNIPANVYTSSPKANIIDELVVKKLQQLRLPLSGQCTDEEFIRRVYLDACGILPTPAEVNKFAASLEKNKRSKLIEALLDRPEFVDYWSYKWSDLLLISTRKLPQPAMWSFYRGVRESVANNKPWNQFTRELLTATGGTLDNGFGNYFVLHKDVAELSEATSVTFMGMSITCARCHNHPMERWTQDQYWSMANLFSRVGLKNGDRQGEVIVTAKASGDVLHPRRGIAMPPTPLDGKPVEIDSPEDRRVAFVDWLTAPENPYFARALVNRIWRNFMGRGLVEAEDDLRETNPPSNRELLDALAKDFVEHGYDVKHLMRQIMNSSAYQRSSKPVDGNGDDDRFYSRYIVRRLSAEVILDAMSQVTGVPTPFNEIYTGVEGGKSGTTNYPMGTRALQLPDSRVASRFLDAFGRPDRIATCSCERQQDATVGQALMLNNGQVLNDKLRAKTSLLNEWLNTKLSDEEVVKQLFLAALSRTPKEHELKKCTALLKAAPVEKQEIRREALEDLFWAVLTTSEFVFNH